MIDTIFLGLRLLSFFLCLYAAWVSIRQARGYWGNPWRVLRACLGGIVSFIVGFVALVVGLRQALHRQGEPIPIEEWLNTLLALVLPVFFLYLLRSFAERDELERQLQAAAERDPLTGLPNRAGFAAQGLTLLEGCRAAKRPVALAMLDIDRFKSINDGWGHAAGDAALRGLAVVVRDNMRTADVFARFGGEEFILLMLNVKAEEALVLVERLRQAIREGVPHPAGDGRRITISAGIAMVEGEDLAAIETAAKAADNALYLAKEAGRDRAIIAS